MLTVGVFRDEDPGRVLNLALKAGVKAVQLHGHETPAQAAEIRPHFPVLIVAMPAGDPKLTSFGRRHPRQPARHPRRRIDPGKRDLRHRAGTAMGS